MGPQAMGFQATSLPAVATAPGWLSGPSQWLGWQLTLALNRRAGEPW